MCLYQVMMTLHVLNDVVNDAESTQKSQIQTGLKSETMGKLIELNTRFAYFDISASLAMSTSVLKALPDKIDIKIRKPSILCI